MSDYRLTQSEENYIKAIYSLSSREKLTVSTNILAERMATKASSVTDMLKKLTDKKIVTYQKYQGCALTEKGRKMALYIIRKHRLWETFLVDKLSFGWDEVHEIAEQLEHIHSSQLINKLEEFLGFPLVDPHGDPIPDRDGNLRNAAIRTSLKSAVAGDTGVVMGVEDGSPDFLKYLNKIGLHLGSVIEVTDTLPLDGSLLVTIDGNPNQFSPLLAGKIFIQLSK
jgi:DtxR family transcriptional regulator, Mn-dependent transcriptional regulator